MTINLQRHIFLMVLSGLVFGGSTSFADSDTSETPSTQRLVPVAHPNKPVKKQPKSLSPDHVLVLTNDDLPKMHRRYESPPIQTTPNPSSPPLQPDVLPSGTGGATETAQPVDTQGTSLDGNGSSRSTK
jgi:hypothetical protein